MLTLLLAASLAAPVSLDTPAVRQKLEAHFADLTNPDPVKRLTAAFALAEHPAAVPFLREKCPPVKATADQIKRWLSDLNSDDEKEWKPAFDKLRYFHPRLAFSTAEQIELITSDQGRLRYANALSGWRIELRDRPDYP